jgi:hypothetical protein
MLRHGHGIDALITFLAMPDMDGAQRRGCSPLDESRHGALC